jgi:hypothetical protein
MKRTQWVIEDESETRVEGRRYANGDSGITMRCSLVCAELGRHSHLVRCESAPGRCHSNEASEHGIRARLGEDGEIAECDWITHKLFWERSGA